MTAIKESDVLRELESEAIYIFRETFASFKKPVLLYSIGKDSSILLHLAKKAFYPGSIPFPVLHIDTEWKFKEMITFRDRIAKELELDLIVHTNPEGAGGKITPFTHGTHEYTRIMKTVSLRQALNAGEYDVAIGGARRDEERSRAKERVFSLREAGHRWEPRKQRPEMWKTFNTLLSDGQTMRSFPISDWTELDVWKYIRQEEIPVVPLYFSKKRPTITKGDQIIMIDDERYPLKDNETPEMKTVRFRTLGCYPLTAGVESDAISIDDLIEETTQVKLSERAGRLIDGDRDESMERKKVEGYF